MYVLRTEAGLSSGQVAELLGRARATVMSLTRVVARGLRGEYAPTVAQIRRILRAGEDRKPIDTRPPRPRSLGGYLVGLGPARAAAGLTKIVRIGTMHAVGE